MGKAQHEQRQQVTFRCSDELCRHRFQAKPDRVDDFPEQNFHPWAYFAKCPRCGSEAGQAAFERNLMKAHANATGPRTAEGKAIVAKNLEGHPTPQEAQLTRFNAMKHGLYANTATFFPAKPGKYPACEGCHHLNNGCGEISQACLKRTELYMRHEIAYAEKNPELLRSDNVRLQATVRALIDDILLEIVRDGVKIKNPVWYSDKDGGFHIACMPASSGDNGDLYEDDDGEIRVAEERLIWEINAHPLLKILIDLMKANNMTLADHSMTPKTADQDEILRGHLAKKVDDEETERDYRERQTKALENMSTLIERSHHRKANDPVLREHSQADVVDAELVERDGADG